VSAPSGSTADLHVVTGAFGYSGKYIATRLLAAGKTVRTLTNSLLRRIRSEPQSRLIPTTSTGPMIWSAPSRGPASSSIPTGFDSTTGTSRILKRSGTPLACSLLRDGQECLGSFTSASQTLLRIRSCPTSVARRSSKRRSAPRGCRMQS
jgi:hypothetical protein